VDLPTFTYHQPVQWPKLITIESYVNITIEFVQLTLAHLYCYNEIKYKNISPLCKLQQRTNCFHQWKHSSKYDEKVHVCEKGQIDLYKSKKIPSNGNIRKLNWLMQSKFQTPKLQQILDLHKRNKLHQILELQILVHDIWSLRFYINKHKKSKHIQPQTSLSSKQEVQFIHVNNVFQMPWALNKLLSQTRITHIISKWNLIHEYNMQTSKPNKVEASHSPTT